MISSVAWLQRGCGTSGLTLAQKPYSDACNASHKPFGRASVNVKRTIDFTDQRPKTFWEGLQAAEYGFWANVNPEVPHPRWSQATEEDIGTKERRPTVKFNGYGEYVADLYKGMEKTERLWV